MLSERVEYPLEPTDEQRARYVNDAAFHAGAFRVADYLRGVLAPEAGREYLLKVAIQIVDRLHPSGSLEEFLDGLQEDAEEPGDCDGEWRVGMETAIRLVREWSKRGGGFWITGGFEPKESPQDAAPDARFGVLDCTARARVAPDGASEQASQVHSSAPVAHSKSQLRRFEAQGVADAKEASEERPLVYLPSRQIIAALTPTDAPPTVHVYGSSNGVNRDAPGDEERVKAAAREIFGLLDVLTSVQQVEEILREDLLRAPVAHTDALEALDDLEGLCSEVRDAHCEYDGPNWNACDEVECAWCESSRVAIDTIRRALRAAPQGDV